MSYASGKFALGECQRSGRIMRLHELVWDGQYPNLLVDPAWRDPKQPQEALKPVDDPVALKHPAPRTDRLNMTVRFPLYDITTGKYGAALFEALDYSGDLNADTFKLALFARKPGASYDDAAEVSGYPRGGVTIDVQASAGRAYLNNVTLAAVTLAPAWLLVYNADSDQGLLRVNLGAVLASRNGDWTVDWSGVTFHSNGTRLTSISL